MYKGVGGEVGGGWGVVGVGGKPEAGYTIQLDCLELLSVQEVLVIGLDQPRWPMRYLTNTGVNIRSIPPI